MTTTRKPVIELLDPEVIESLRRMTPSERLMQAFRFWKTARIIVIGAIRYEHPEFTEEQVQRECANRLSHGATERARAQMERERERRSRT